MSGPQVEVRSLRLLGFHGYRIAELVLREDLATWSFREYAAGRHDWSSAQPVRCYLVEGRGLLAGKEIRAGDLVELSAGSATLECEQPIGMRVSFPSHRAQWKQVHELTFRLPPFPPIAQGEWSPAPDLPATPEGCSRVYFAVRPGALARQLFEKAGSADSFQPGEPGGRTVDFESVQLDRVSFPLEGWEPDSWVMRTVSWSTTLSERLADLRQEEYFERQPDGWKRWTPLATGSLRLDEPCQSLTNRDAEVDALLSRIWTSGESLLQHLCAVPGDPTRYEVPYLHLPGGTVSSALREKWGIEAVCSHASPFLSPRDLVVSIDAERISWCCKAASEMAEWSYARSDQGEYVLHLSNIYF